MNHDFLSNFDGSVDSGDVELSLDLWVNEISDLIVIDSDKVVALLNKTNVPAKITDSDEELVDKILTNVGTNKKLNRGISFLIGEQNNLIKEESNDWREVIDKIANTYEVVLVKFSQIPSLKASVKNDIMQHIKSKANSSKESSGVDGSTAGGRVIFKEETPDEVKTKRKKIFWWVVGGVVVLTAIGFGIHYYRKNKKAASLLGEGGALLNGGSTPTPTPIPTVKPNATTVAVTAANVTAPTAVPTNITPTV
jgi:hypothetical protein